MKNNSLLEIVEKTKNLFDDFEKLQNALFEILGTYTIYNEADKYYLEIMGTDYDFEISKTTYEVIKKYEQKTNI